MLGFEEFSRMISPGHGDRSESKMSSLFDIADGIRDKYTFFRLQVILFKYDFEFLDFWSMSIDSQNGSNESSISS